MKQLVLLVAIVTLMSGFAAAIVGPDEFLLSQEGRILGTTPESEIRLEMTVTMEAGANITGALSALKFAGGFPGAYQYEDAVFPSPGANSPTINPTSLEFQWATLPDLSQPYTFTYVVQYPSTASWPSVSGKATYQTVSVPVDSGEVTTPINAIACLDMTRTIVGGGYIPGQRLDIEVTINSYCGEPVTALALEETLPADWSFVSATGAGDGNSSILPSGGDTGVLQFVWFSPIPTFPYTFTYTVLVPTITTGDQPMSGVVINRLSGPELRTPPIDTVISPLDLVEPVVMLNGGSREQIECSATYIEQGATASDDVDGPLSVSISGTVDNFKPDTYTLTYSATDSSGNVGSATRTITVVDTNDPILQLNGANPFTVSCGGLFQDPGATATDGCAGSLTSEIVPISNVNAGVLGPYTVQYSVQDPSGNTASLTRTVIVEDITPPAISLTGAAEMTVPCGSVFNDPGATSTDACAGSSSTISVAGSVDTTVLGAHILSYRATDPSGNRSNYVDRTVTVVDTTPPVISLNGGSVVNLACGQAYTEAGATVVDTCYGTLSTNLAPTGAVNTASAGAYTLYYNISDDAGNAAAQVTRTVNVLDTVAPVITLNGDATVTVSCGQAYTDAGATAEDACAGRLTNITVDNPVDTAIPQTYTVSYNVKDPSGNDAVEVTRQVIVEDKTAPVIALNGQSTMTITCNGTYNESGASATDECAGALTGITISGAVNPAVPQTYTLSYSVSDPSGNAAATVTRTVIVQDTVAPVLTLNGPANVDVECGSLFSSLDPGASAADACAGDLTSLVQRTGAVDGHVPGNYTYTYNVSDPSGNAATPVERTFHVADTSAPEISLNGANPLTLDCGQSYEELGASALDACDGAVEVDIDASAADTSGPGSFLVSYSATDAAGHTAVETRTVLIAGPGCATEGETAYCPLDSVQLLTPANNVLIPGVASTVNVQLTSAAAFDSGDSCIFGTVQMVYDVNGSVYGPSTDMANHFPVTVSLKAGVYTVRATATVNETGETASTQRTFEVQSIQIAPNGYLNHPFEVLNQDGTTFNNTIQDGYYDRTIEMVSALCPADGGSTDDIVLNVNHAGDMTQTLTVTVPRSIVPCGNLAIVVVTVSDTLAGLLGPDQAALLSPSPNGLVAGALFFDISIVLASLSDINDGDGNTTYWEIDNALVAQNPVRFSLNGLNFTPNLVPLFLSHPTDFLPSEDASLNLLGASGVWSWDFTRNFVVEGTTLSGEATSLSIFAPFEKEMSLKFTPNAAYGVIFGRAAHDTSIEQTFTVTNTGELPITGQATVVDPTGIFELVGNANYSLTAGQSQEITVRFTPDEMVDYTGQLHFSGDPEGDIFVTLRGTGTITQKLLSFFGCAPSAGPGFGGDWLVLVLAAAALFGLSWRRASRQG